MRKTLPVVVVAMFACKSGKGTEGSGSTTATQAAVTATKVAAAVIASPKQPPPVLVIVDAAGKLSVNAAPAWDAIAKLDLAAGAHPADRRSLEMLLAEGVGMGLSPNKIVASFDRPKSDIDRELLEYTGSAGDDPPPPPPEDMPDDGVDELDQGNHAERKEGDYHMKKPVEDPRIALHKIGGYRGPIAKYTGYADVERASVVVGEVERDGKLEDRDQHAVVVAAPRAKATAMIDAVMLTEGLIAVATDTGVRPLRTQFLGDRDRGLADPRHWIELHVGVSTLAFEAVPDVPVAVGSFEQAAFAAALAKARDGRKLDPRTPVDVLVDADVDAQRLVDAIVALDQAGVTMIGLGTAPAANSDAAKLRGARRSMVESKQLNSQGQLDKALIRKAVAENIRKVHTCYDTALAKTPTLAGTVNVQFFIKPDGKVATASAAGVDPEVATCIADVIKAIVFPKPTGGGGVQVNYPFALEP